LPRQRFGPEGEIVAIKHALRGGDMPMPSAQALQAFRDAGYALCRASMRRHRSGLAACTPYASGVTINGCCFRLVNRFQPD